MSDTSTAGQFVGSIDISHRIGLICLLLGTTALPYTDFFPRFASYVMIVPVYGLLIFLWVNERYEDLRIPQYVLWTLGAIWSIYLLNMGFSIVAGNVESGMLIRVPSFIIFTGLTLFIVPSLIPRRVFLTALSGFGVFLVIIALPTLIIPQYGIGPLQIKQWGPTFQLLPSIGITVHPIKSIFSNPNTLSFIVAVGLVSAVGEYMRQRNKQSKVKVVILATGLYMAHGRAAIGAASIGIAILILFTIYPRKKFQQLTVVGFGAGVCGFLVLTGIISLPISFPTLNFQGRIELWEGSVRAVIQRPLFGYGPGDTGELIAPFVEKNSGYSPHNSYLRMFVTTGLVGGTAYVFLISKIIYDQFISLLSKREATLFAICVVVTAIQFFEVFSLFGLSLNSVVTALAYGYGIRSMITKTSQLSR